MPQVMRWHTCTKLNASFLHLVHSSDECSVEHMFVLISSHIQSLPLTGQPPPPTILYVYCTEAPQSHTRQPLNILR